MRFLKPLIYSYAKHGLLSHVFFGLILFTLPFLLLYIIQEHKKQNKSLIFSINKGKTCLEIDNKNEGWPVKTTNPTGLCLTPSFLLNGNSFFHIILYIEFILFYFHVKLIKCCHSNVVWSLSYNITVRRKCISLLVSFVGSYFEMHCIFSKSSFFFCDNKTTFFFFYNNKRS
jgi:hypothetical protein